MKWVIVMIFLAFPVTKADTPVTAQDIVNFRQVTALFSIAGLPSFEQVESLAQDNYQHLINLVPGDFEAQKFQVESHNITFNQIPVDWNNPTLDDFKQFVALMQAYKGEKTLLHCEVNYRASTFAYLYQTTQLNENHQQALQRLESVWKPNKTWQEFIKKVQQHYL